MQEHPYLLFDHKEAGELYERLKQGVRGRVFIKAALAQSHAFCDPASEHFFDFQERESDYWTSRMGQFKIPARLLTLAITGWICKEDKFLEFCKDALITLIKGNVIDNLGDYKTWRKNGQHDAGKFFATLGLLYDLLYPFFNAEEKKLVLETCKETLDISIDFFEDASKYVDNNRGNRYFSGRAILGCAIVHDFPDYAFAKICADSGPLSVERGLRLAFGRDGEPYEGASYGTSNLEFFYLTAYILKRLGIRDCTNDRRFKNIGQYVLYETVTSGPQNEDGVLNRGWLNTLNDASRVSVPDCLYLSALKSENPYYLWLWDRYALDPKNQKSNVHPNFIPSDFKDVPWKLLWPDDEAIESRDPNEANVPKTFYFRNRGIISSRSGWSELDLHATVFAGTNSLKGHRQADQGQVTFYAYGEHFLIDTGYVSPKLIKNVKKVAEGVNGVYPESHNLIAIDGKGQSHRLDEFMGWPIAYLDDYKQSENHFEVTCDLREAYPHNSSLVEAKRYFSLSHTSDIPHAVWIDKLNCDGREHLYSLYLHTARGNRFEIQDGLITIHGLQNSLDIHIKSKSKMSFFEDEYADHPRLRIDQHTICSEYIMLLHPWSDGNMRLHPEIIIRDREVEIQMKKDVKSIVRI